MGMSVVFIATLIFAMAGISYGVRQYSIRQDEAIGAEKRKQQEAQAHGAGSQQEIEKEARDILRTLEDSLATSKDTSLYLQIGLLRFKLNDIQGALNIYAQYTTTVNPNNVQAKVDYGYLLFNADKRTEAITLTRAVLKQHPLNQAALYNMGFMMYQTEQFEEATRWMYMAMNADSTSETGLQAKFAFEEFKRKADSVKTITK